MVPIRDFWLFLTDLSLLPCPLGLCRPPSVLTGCSAHGQLSQFLSAREEMPEMSQRLVAGPYVRSYQCSSSGKERRAAVQADFKTGLLRHRSGAGPGSLHFPQAPRGCQRCSTVAHTLRSTGLKTAGGTARSWKGAWMESDIDNPWAPMIHCICCICPGRWTYVIYSFVDWKAYSKGKETRNKII